MENQEDKYLTELADDIEVVKPQLERFKIDVGKAIRKFEKDTFFVPFSLVARIFEFEVDRNGYTRLKQVDRDYWNAIRLYVLLQFKENKEGTKRFIAGVRFLMKGLGCKHDALHRALQILRDTKLIKTRKEGQKTHAIKHYITLL